MQNYDIWPRSRRHPSVDGDDNGAGDGVPDEIEDDLGLRPTHGDSLHMADTFGKYDPDQVDVEIVARMFEHEAPDGDVDKDWASDGLNCGLTPNPQFPGRTNEIEPPNRSIRHPSDPEQLLGSLVWPTLPNWF